MFDNLYIQIHWLSIIANQLNESVISFTLSLTIPKMEKKNHQFLNGKMFYYLYCHDQFFYCKNDMETIEFQSRNPQAG